MNASRTPSALRLVVLISGGGTTLKNLLDKIGAGQLQAEILLVVSSNPQARGLQIAQSAGIPTKVIDRKSCSTPEAYSNALFGACRAIGTEYVVMGGFLTHVLIPTDFENRVLNIHPALIPAFCGKGFFGHRVHEAVLGYGAKVSGCTVHFVDNQYDHGPIILQHIVPVLDDDTPDTLAARVFEAECEVYPEALRMLASGKVTVMGRNVKFE
ncbi:MAG: phosphoribosylglycinamide formyltransferase [Planctomycetia bacterium]|nr:phosphoribosylglycinamide formyltransferase [Planctomycetia bacterium]